VGGDDGDSAGTIHDEATSAERPVLLVLVGAGDAQHALIAASVPAWTGLAHDAAPALRMAADLATAGAAGAPAARSWFAEIGLSTVLLSAPADGADAGRHAARAVTYRPDADLTMRVPLPEARYPTAEDRARVPAPAGAVTALPACRPPRRQRPAFVGRPRPAYHDSGQPKIDQGSLVHETARLSADPAGGSWRPRCRIGGHRRVRRLASSPRLRAPVLRRRPDRPDRQLTIWARARACRHRLRGVG
jgi:hypothetical protein